MSLFRVYDGVDEIGVDGYPLAWHRIPIPEEQLEFLFGVRRAGIKDLVRAEAENRCVRCGHPYSKGDGEWSNCDERCSHGGPVRMWVKSDVRADRWVELEDGSPTHVRNAIQARWRILTGHHLNGVKADCRWWNLVALCQRCHLSIQGKVKMDRPYDRPHTSWFVPYVCGFYASKYLGEEIDRKEALERQEELLMLELRQEPLFT